MHEDQSLLVLFLKVVVVLGALAFLKKWMMRSATKYRQRYIEGANGVPLPETLFKIGVFSFFAGWILAYYAIYVPYEAVQRHENVITYSPEIAALSIIFILMGCIGIFRNRWYSTHYEDIKSFSAVLPRRWKIIFFSMGLLLIGSVEFFFESHGYKTIHSLSSAVQASKTDVPE